MKKTGRKSKYTPERVKKIVQLIEEGNFADTSAKLAGIGESTFYQWKQRHEEFAEVIKKAEATRESNLLSEIVNAKDASGRAIWTAKAWVLERLHRDKYHLPTVVEKEMEERLLALENQLAGTASA